MKVYSAETWARARELYCGGMSLEAVGKKLGIPYSTVRDHGWTEEWGVRGKGVQRDPRAEQRKARRIKAKLAREEALMIVETSLVKAEELEVIARQCLVADSARMKVVISRKVGEILQRLDPSVPPRSAAQAIGALAPIFRLLYKWQDEPSEADLKAAKGPNHAINIALIQTAPEELRMMGPHREDASLQTEQKDQLDGTRLIEDAPIPAPAGDGDHLPKKEAPTLRLQDRIFTRATTTTLPRRCISSEAMGPFQKSTRTNRVPGTVALSRKRRTLCRTHPTRARELPNHKRTNRDPSAPRTRPCAHGNWKN